MTKRSMSCCNFDMGWCGFRRISFLFGDELCLKTFTTAHLVTFSAERPRRSSSQAVLCLRRRNIWDLDNASLSKVFSAEHIVELVSIYYLLESSKCTHYTTETNPKKPPTDCAWIGNWSPISDKAARMCIASRRMFETIRTQAERLCLQHPRHIFFMMIQIAALWSHVLHGLVHMNSGNNRRLLKSTDQSSHGIRKTPIINTSMQ